MNPVFKLSAAIIFLVFGVFGCQEQIKTSGSSLEVVFEEDFESPEDYQKRWQASSGWSLVVGQIDGRKTKVLDIRGGNEGLSVRGGLADFDYEADLRVVRQGGGFLFRARDADNLYMLRLVSDNRPWDRDKLPTLTDSFYPHTKKNGKYSADVKQPLTRRLPMREWFHIKFEVRGNRFKIYLGETRSPDRMELVGQWEEKKPFKDGRFGFRCSGSEHLQVDNIRISTPGPLQPGLVIKPFASPRMITTGQSFDVKVHVQNTGWKSAANIKATLSLPPGLELVQVSPTQSCSTLKIGADRWFSWKVKTTKAVAGRMQIAVTYDGLPVAKTIPVDYVVNPALPIISAQQAQPTAARIDAQDNVILENQNLRMVFVKNLDGYTAAVVSAYDGKQWRQMAVSQPIGKISYRANAGSAVETVIIPTQYEILNPSGAVARVRFTSQLVDDDNVTWSFAYTFELEADKSNIKTNYQASANNNRQLLYFQGPDLYAGEGSFGSSKDLAIFPGLEYLEAEEQSSSTRDMANFITFHNNAVGNRYVPHPHKITMPLMGLEQNNGLIGLMWDPLQKWGGDYTRPAARFASPNYIEKQENHLMGLFLPSVPDFVPENDDAASSPYPLTANSQVTLEAYIVAQAPGEVLDMLDQYYAIFGMPEKIDDMSITYEEALEWGRVGYMETIYDPATNGIRLWEQSPAYPAPGAIATLFRLSLDTTDPAKKKVIRDRVDVMVNRALKNEGVKGLTDSLDGRHFPFDTKFPAGCLLRTHMLPFYIGYLEEGIAAWKTRVYEELINTQRQDGTWEYAGEDVLTPVLWSPELSRHFDREISSGSTGRSLLKLAALLHDIAKPQTRIIDDDGRARFLGHQQEGAATAAAIMERLRSSNREIKLVELLIKYHLRPTQMSHEGIPTHRAIYRYFRDTGEAGIDLLFLCLADHLATRGPSLDPRQWQEHTQMTEYVLARHFEEESLSAPPKLIDGHDVMKTFGLSPGPRVGELLETLREAQAAGEVTTRQQAHDYIGHLLNNQTQTLRSEPSQGEK